MYIDNLEYAPSTQEDLPRPPICNMTIVCSGYTLPRLTEESINFVSTWINKPHWSLRENCEKEQNVPCATKELGNETDEIFFQQIFFYHRKRRKKKPHKRGMNCTQINWPSRYQKELRNEQEHEKKKKKQKRKKRLNPVFLLFSISHFFPLLVIVRWIGSTHLQKYPLWRN